MKSKVDFQHDPINTLLLKIAVPAFWGIAVSLIFSFVDGIFIGKGIGNQALSGVSIIFPVTFFITALSSLVGEGAASVVARAMAGGNQSRARAYIETALAVCLLIGVVTLLVSYVFSENIALFFGADEDNLLYAKEYFQALAFGFPFFAISIIYYHILNAQGEMRSASRAIVVTTLLNIVLDYGAIYVLNLGVAGAAYATVIAQAICSLWLYIYALRSHEVLSVALPKFAGGSLPRIKVIVYVGMGSFVRQLGIVFSLALINRAAAFYGNYVYVASFGAAIRILRLFLSPIAAVSLAFKPIAGHSFGHKAYDRLKEAVNKTFIQNILQGSVLLALLLAFRQPLGGLFGIEGDNTAIFSHILLIIAVSFPVVGLHHTTTAYFVAIGRPNPAITLNVLKQFLLLIPLVYVLPRQFGIYGVFWAMPISDLLSIVVAYLWLNLDLNNRTKTLLLSTSGD